MKILSFILIEFLLPFFISVCCYESSYNLHEAGYNPHESGYNPHENICPPLTGKNVKHFRRVVSYGTVQPDNYPQRGILTDGYFPARPIVVYQGDTVVIEFVNYCQDNFTLHFHGIQQIGTVRSDGVPYFTQMPVTPNSTYYYIINVGKQLGTFLYHAHTNLHLVWVFAPFIILENEKDGYNKPLQSYHGYYYDGERTLTISQCWHQSIESMYIGLKAAPFENIPETDSILINGKSYGEWPGHNGNSTGFHVVYVEQHQCIRFRVISICSESAVQFTIENHRGHVIEIDGIITNPVSTDHLNIYTAQRYSFVVCMDQPIGNYKIRAKIMPTGPDNGVAILHYKGAADPRPLRKVLSKKPETGLMEEPLWLKGKLCPSIAFPQSVVYPFPKHNDQEIIIRTFQITAENGTKYFEVNGVFNPKPLNTSFIDLIQKEHVRVSENWQGVYELYKGQNIQIVFINHVGSDGSCETHPWHLHGHAVYIVGDGADDYRPEIEGVVIQKKIDYLSNYYNNRQMCFTLRDVIPLFPNQTNNQAAPGSPCGWVAIRFLANNPGFWMVHCHPTAHLIMGQRFELYEHKREDPFLQEQCYYNGHYSKSY